MDSTKTNNLTLDMPVQFIKGVGPAKAQAFADLGVHTLADLLEYYPRNWTFMPEPVKIEDTRPDQTVTIAGLIEQTDYQPYKRKPIFKAFIADDTAVCQLLWFNGGYLRNQLEPGQVIMASGKIKLYKYQKQMTNPKFTILDNPEQIDPEYFNGPTYPASGKLSSLQIRRIIKPIINDASKLAPEFYDDSFRSKAHMMPRQRAFDQIHFPDDEETLVNAKRRLKYENSS